MSNPNMFLDTFVATLGQSSVMSSVGYAFQKQGNAVKDGLSQTYTGLIQRNGADFAKSLANQFFETGAITEAELKSHNQLIDKLSKSVKQLAATGIVGDRAQLTVSLSGKVEQLKELAAEEQDPAMKQVYQSRLTAVQSELRPVS